MRFRSAFGLSKAELRSTVSGSQGPTHQSAVAEPRSSADNFHAATTTRSSSFPSQQCCLRAAIVLAHLAPSIALYLLSEFQMTVPAPHRQAGDQPAMLQSAPTAIIMLPATPPPYNRSNHLDLGLPCLAHLRVSHATHPVRNMA